MTAPRPLISAEEGIARKAAIDFARGSVRFEGFVWSPQVEELAQRFIAGEITATERIDAIKRLYPEAERRSQAYEGAVTGHRIAELHLAQRGYSLS